MKDIQQKTTNKLTKKTPP